ncbi:MAG: hypothetical protein GY850_21310, partial [bacterium]|nr:hypothetical protein [bacterium]
MKHTAKITPSTLWMALLFILISLLIIACSRDDPETPLDESEVEQVTIKAADIAGPDGTIIYQGEEKTGSVRVPENALVGVMKDGEPYLYHPSLGEVDLTAETSRRAVGLFIEGLLNDESFAAVAARRAGSNDTPAELGPDDDLLMSSGLALHRFKRKDLIRFTVENLVNRWVGLKLPDGTTRLIPPRARKFDSNMARWLVSEGHADIAKSLLQHSEDPYQSIASLYKAEVDSEKTGDVEIFGATFRAGNHMGPYDLPPGTEEARAADRDFYNLVNMFDLYYVVLEGMKYIGSTVITLECLDIAFGAMANLGGYGFFSFLSEDEGVSEYFSKVLKEDFYNSLYNCAYVAGSFGVWEIVQTFFDIVGALNWIEEDIATPDPIVMKAACYEKFELVSDNPCSLHTYLDFEYGEIEQTG